MAEIDALHDYEKFEFSDGRISRENVWVDGAAAIAQLERTLGKKTMELEIAGKLLRDWE
jgi:hypothetical protein